MTCFHGNSTKLCLLLLVLALTDSSHGDLCLTLDDDDKPIAEYVHQRATPRGGERAGVYTHGMLDGRNASSLPDCLLSCCDAPSCNVMFFHRERCYLIECNRSQPDACDPVVHKDDEKLAKTFLISVRTLADTAHLYNMPTDKSDGDSGGDTQQEAGSNAQCIMGSNKGCGVGEQCNMVSREGGVSYVCDCTKGLARHADTNECTVRSVDLTCEYGLSRECFDNEECVPQHGRSRVGACQCVDGFQRDAETRLCEPRTDAPDLDSAKDLTDKSSLSEISIIKSVDEKKSSSVEVGSPSSSADNPASSDLHPPLAPLVVSAGENREITLPNNDVTLSAFVVPNDENAGYQYKWELVTQPDHDDESVGDMVGMDSNSLQLSKLIAGLYTFKVVVTAQGKYGEAYVNVSVNLPARINVPPTAIIKPTTQSISQPNDVVLDGSVSTDDDKVIKYQWEQVSGPVESPGIGEKDVDKSMLVLKGLTPGQYMYKLTVTDSDAMQTSTFANVTVIKETDYPPRANAGSNVIISLPQTSVTLYGNASTDDKGIASYEWIKNSDDKFTADMKGVRTPILQLENLEQGDYTFTLKVTDTAGNTDTADVHVFVKAEHNKAPVASAGKNKTIWLPQSTVTLDATNSTDDQKITSYLWSQISGPSSIAIENEDRAVSTVSKLVVGAYKFKVTVTDAEKLQGSAFVYITVKQDNNKPPVAHAGGVTVVVLPASLVQLDGTGSTDDRQIVAWLWERTADSLAAGDIVNGSDHQPVLLLTGLVAGRYMFRLTVTDDDGLSASDTATLTVNSEQNKEDIVELMLDTEIGSFTQRNKKNLQSQIAMLLQRNLPGTAANIQELVEDRSSGRLIVLFYVTRSVSGTSLEVVPGHLVARALRDRLWSDTNLLDYPAVSVDTLVCQNNCSSHGQCDQSTKKCMCEAFWMENPFRAYIAGTSNCQWSILYVIIVAFITMVTMIGVIWGLVFICKRWYWTRPKKRHRYMLLDEPEDDDTKENVELMQKGKIGKIQSSSLMVSESDFSSDEETLFINKKANGHAGKNGFIRPGKTKVKA